jgi:hypothetical protein
MCFGKNVYASTRPLHAPNLPRRPSIPMRAGRCMYNRAVLLEREGLLTEAEDMQRRCLLLRERVLGQDNQQVH